MSYSISNSNVVSNAKGVEVGVYHPYPMTFTFNDKASERFKSQVSGFLKRLGHKVEAWDTAGEEPEAEPGAEVVIPPQPKLNPKWGHKTPGYVRWLEKYHLEEFKTRFGITGRGTVPIVEDGVTIGHRETWIGRCKTVLSEKVNLPPGMDPNLYDINAE